MTDREKLIELIQHEVVPYFAERIADHLISNGVTFQQWIPVTERLPEHFKQVLLWDAIDEDVFTGELDGNNEWFIAHFEDEVFNITHWMQLPEPPKEV